MRRIVLIVIIMFVTNTQAYAIDTSVDTSTSNKSSTDKSLSTKSTKEKRATTGDKRTASKSTGIDRQLQEAMRNADQQMQQSALDITVAVDQLFAPAILRLETEDRGIYGRCKAMSHPLTVAELGLTGRRKSGIDVFAQDYYAQGAKSNMLLSPKQTERVAEYISCLTGYARAISKAAAEMDVIVNRVSARTGHALKGISREELEAIATECIYNTISKYDIVTVEQCYLDGDVTRIRCNEYQLDFAAQSLKQGNMTIFGREGYMGQTASYKLSSSMSYSKAIERLQSISKYSKTAHDVTTYTEQMQSQGRAAEAALARKIAYEQMLSGKASVSVSRLLPTP